jgi:hypothetical protein
MRSIVSIVTAVAVSLHIVLGCCAHHAHGRSDGSGAGHRHDASEHACSHHHDHDDANTPGEPQAPLFPPHDDCHESHCDVVLIAAKSFTPELAVVLLPPAADEQATWLAWQRIATCEPRDPIEPNVRPHLLHQVFLN